MNKITIEILRSTYRNLVERRRASAGCPYCRGEVDPTLRFAPGGACARSACEIAHALSLDALARPASQMWADVAAEARRVAVQPRVKSC